MRVELTAADVKLIYKRLIRSIKSPSDEEEVTKFLIYFGSKTRGLDEIQPSRRIKSPAQLVETEEDEGDDDF